MNKKIKIFLVFTIPLFLILHFLGWIKFYYTLVGYDKIVHFLAGASVVLVVCWFLEEKQIKINKIFTSFIVLFFVAVLWEILEFLIDNIIGRSILGPLQQSKTDTLTDFIANFIGASFIFLCLYFEQKKHCLK